MSILDKALLRIANFYRMSSPVDMGEVYEEYGDLSDYDLPEEEVDYGGLTEEQFVHGETVMALLG